MVKVHKNELGKQREFINAVRAAGGYGEKLSHRFNSGIPDLIVKFPNTPVIMVECKHEVYTNMPVSVPVALTPLQRKTLRDMRASGIIAGWVIFVSVLRRTYILACDDLEIHRCLMPKEPLIWDKTENATWQTLEKIISP